MSNSLSPSGPAFPRQRYREASLCCAPHLPQHLSVQSAQQSVCTEDERGVNHFTGLVRYLNTVKDCGFCACVVCLCSLCLPGVSMRACVCL